MMAIMIMTHKHPHPEYGRFVYVQYRRWRAGRGVIGSLMGSIGSGILRPLDLYQLMNVSM